MRCLAAVAALCLGGGCGSSRREAAPVPAAPEAWPCALAADGGRAHGLRMELQGEIERRQAAGTLADLFAERPGELSDFAGLASRRDPLVASTIVTCPDAAFRLGRGLVTDLVLGLRTAVDRDEDDGLRATSVRGAYADWSDGWTLHMTPPRDAFDDMHVLETHADVWLSIARRWATVEVTLAVTVGEDRLVLTAPPLEAPVADRGAPLHDGFRLVSATVDGQPADLVLGAGGYLVIGGLGHRLSRVALRYEGPLPLVGENQGERRVLELNRWMPWVPYAAPSPLTLAVHHPPAETLVASVPAAGDAETAGDWRTERFAALVDRDPALLLTDAPPDGITWDDGRGSRIELSASPPIHADDCGPSLARVVAALAPLGPIGHVRVVGVPAVYGRHGRRAGDLVVVLRDKLVDLCTATGPEHDVAVELVAHELAHGWFGRDVRAADDEASAWYEAVAEYVSSWAVDDRAAGALRQHWLDAYDDEADADDLAMASRVPTGGALRDALSYDKGALLLTALEDVIGRDRLAAVLHHLIDRRRGGIGSWLDVYAATAEVAGSQAAGWLQRWLFAIGAPRLALADVTVAGGRARLSIVQDADPPFAATVGVGVFRGDDLLTFARVPLAGARTRVTLDAPAGADRIAVDPFARLPRAGDGWVTLR